MRDRDVTLCTVRDHDSTGIGRAGTGQAVVGAVPSALLLIASLVLGGERVGAGEAGSQSSCAPAPTGTSQTFEYTGSAQQFQVPAGVSRVSIEVLGGHGGQEGSTGPGGAGGGATGSFAVSPGDCLTVYVGGFGYGHGGFGYGQGGDHGTAPGGASGHSAGGGGGGSAVTAWSNEGLSDQPILVAGGGGGGGGDGSPANDGGAGGSGTADESGFGGRPGAQGQNGGGAGGCGGCNVDPQSNNPAPDGIDGSDTHLLKPVTGAGGGGGGGWQGGGGGSAAPKDYLGGGGGGGGGTGVNSYFVDPNTNFTWYTNSRPCPPGDSVPPTCNGRVVVSWGPGLRTVTAVGGSGQHLWKSNFQPLSAKVTDSSGQPVSNATVAFTLPPIPPSRVEPSGTWVYELSDSQTYLATTNAGGIATTPEIAGDQIGGTFTVVASVSHAASVARFTLTNDPIPTTTALSSSANPSVPGESIAFTASVTAPDTGLFVGDVQFTVDGAPLGPAVPVDLFGQATSASIALEEGKHEIVVVFAPNASFLGSSASLIQMVKANK